jgi:hypothetical protein
MIRRIAMSIAMVAIVLAGNAYAQDEDGCASARYSAAGQYARCEGKAAAKEFSDALFLKCRQKYAAAWTRLGTMYPGTSCVGARYVDGGDGTITDRLTRLVWEKKDSSDGISNLSNRHDVDNTYIWSAVDDDADGTTFTDFLDSLNSTGFAGQHDWRMPTLYELHTILSTDAWPCATTPCVADSILLPTSSNGYWSSTPYAEQPLRVWPGIFSNTGDTFHAVKTDTNYIRAVRGGS